MVTSRGREEYQEWVSATVAEDEIVPESLMDDPPWATGDDWDLIDEYYDQIWEDYQKQVGGW